MTGLDQISVVVFWLGAAWLLYVYWGYGVLLSLVAAGRAKPSQGQEIEDGSWPSVTVLLTVHNEERLVERRLENLLTQAYAGKLEIVVASDGSTDRTDSLVSALARQGSLRLVRSDRRGKSAAQNAAMETISSEIVVLTDARTGFATSCLRALVEPFADSAIGCVTAELQPVDSVDDIGRNQSRYWSYELKLRRLESRLGILAVASGSAMAVRRDLFQHLPTFTGDDCAIPLQVVSQGYRVIHNEDARAWDRLQEGTSGELAARVRMTTRNWTGTWLYSRLLNPLMHPGYALALWSHKLMRWLGSLVLVLMMVCAIHLIVAGTERIFAGLFAVAMLTGGFGWLARARGRRLPLAGAPYAFLLANLGFLVGIAKAMVGRRVHIYGRTTS